MLPALQRLVALVPWSWRRSVYRYPTIARGVRRVLNEVVGTGPKTVAVTAGPLKGSRFELDLQHEKHFWLGTHEPQAQEWLSANIKPGWVVYDVGANLGYFTLLLSRLVGDRGLVIAFEPDPANVHRLRRTMELNEVENVEIVPSAVSVESGPLQLLAGRGTTSLVHLPGTSAPSSDDVAISVSDVSLDDFALESGHPSPHFIKVDVEGHEGEVLLGARRLLATRHPHLLCEVHSAVCGKAVERVLTESGYTLLQVEAGSSELPCVGSVLSGHFVGLPPGTPYQ